MTAHTLAWHAGSNAFGRLLDRFVFKPFAEWRARNAAFDELSSLDDHMLADIGIARSQIPGVVADMARSRHAVNENDPSVAA